MKEVLFLLKLSGLFCIRGMTTELGYKTPRARLNGLKECEDWLRNKPNNSLRFLFEDGNHIDFEL